MTKKIWRLLCIFSVFLAGILLYEGGVLVFRFQARREGLLTCFAGGCAAVFYLAAFQRSGREQGETKVKVWKMILVEGAAALLAAGGTLYVCRYQDRSGIAIPDYGNCIECGIGISLAKSFQ